MVVRVECAPGLTGGGGEGSVGGGLGGEDSDEEGADALAFVSIDEPPESCRYTVVLAGRGVCAHPDLARSRAITAQATPRDVPCYAQRRDAAAKSKA